MKALSLTVVASFLMALVAGSASAQPTIQYKVPEGWTVSPEARQMRHATIITPTKTEVVVTVFGGTVGGDLANVNRWRQQVGLEGIQQADLEKNWTKVQTADANASAKVIDFTGPKGRILAAIIPQGDRTWFIRTMGDSEAVAKTKDGFDAMVKSVSFK
jgi:hypothetical protein